MSAGRIILDFFKKHWIRYIFGIFIIIISTYSLTIIPKYLGQAVDALNIPDAKNIDINQVRHIAMLIAVAGVIAFLSRVLWRYLILGFCRHIEFFLRACLFRHLQMLPAEYYIKNNTGYLITRAISDVQAVRMMMGFAVVAVIDTVATTVLSIRNMSAAMSLPITLLALSPIPFIILVIVKVRVLVRKRYVRVQDALSNISSKVQENVTGIRVIKAFAQEDKEAEVFDRLSVKKVETEIALAKASAVIGPSVQLTFGIVFSIFLVVGGGMVAKGAITLGDYVMFNTYLTLIMVPVGNVGRIVDRWQRGMGSLRRLDKIFLEKPSIDDANADMSVTKLETGSIEARNLTFSYDDANSDANDGSGHSSDGSAKSSDNGSGANSGVSCNEIINDLSFSVPSGETLAVIGATGCGKSTFAGLLMRVWACGDGMLYIDGRDINTIPLKVLRENCAYVPQETFLFSDTIKENIRFCDPGITDEQVFAAARTACVHDSIMEFPLGYDTVVGERGMTLSGGQKQRVALARALVRSPRILILDDCMSAVDANTEKQIIENLKGYIEGCTAVIMTHRLSAASLADRVLVINSDGSMAEIGSHEELMLKGGAYVRMADSVRAEEAGTDAVSTEEGDADA